MPTLPEAVKWRWEGKIVIRVIEVISSDCAGLVSRRAAADREVPKRMGCQRLLALRSADHGGHL